MTKQPITIVLADDHAMVRGTIKRRLQDESDFNVVASVATTDEAVTEAIRTQPNVVLMDIDMPGTYCFQAAKTIQELCPGTHVVFLSAFFHDRYIQQAISVNAWGYVVKSDSEDNLVMAIRTAASGATYFSPEIQSKLVVDDGVLRMAAPDHTRLNILTHREMEVLRHIARGLSQKEIAQAMHISANTVHRHTDSIMSKLEIHSRVELARLAIREGIAEA